MVDNVWEDWFVEVSVMDRDCEIIDLSGGWESEGECSTGMGVKEAMEMDTEGEWENEVWGNWDIVEEGIWEMVAAAGQEMGDEGRWEKSAEEESVGDIGDWVQDKVEDREFGIAEGCEIVEDEGWEMVPEEDCEMAAEAGWKMMEDGGWVIVADVDSDAGVACNVNVSSCPSFSVSSTTEYMPDWKRKKIAIYYQKIKSLSFWSISSVNKSKYIHKLLFSVYKAVGMSKQKLLLKDIQHK